MVSTTFIFSNDKFRLNHVYVYITLCNMRSTIVNQIQTKIERHAWTKKVTNFDLLFHLAANFLKLCKKRGIRVCEYIL